MAGGAQGGGGAPGQPSPQGQSQFNPQAFSQYQNALQNFRQGAAGMPSQLPGANMAAMGGVSQPLTAGAFPQVQGGVSQPLTAGTLPQQMPQTPQGAQQFAANIMPAMVGAAPGGDMTMASTRPEPVAAPGGDMVSGRTMEAMIGPAPQQPQGLMPPQAVSQEQLMRMLMANRGPMPQIQGNPNAMPVQRGMRGRGRGGYG